jgi:glutamate/tyrosine decarboxylase-like PLP-dependent enzyme
MTTDLFPENGMNDDEILTGLAALSSDDLSSNGKAFAFIYDAGAEVNALARKAFAASMGGNGLDPTVYPSARRLETQIVGACLQHLRAPEGAVGTATSGGTESVMLSVKTARDYARKNRPEIDQPNMLVPETAHASFHKAAHYFGVRLVPVDVHPETMEASVADMASKIDANTVLLVASAPSYAHGVIDPIADIGALAEKNDLLLHVDACIGGWVLPFQRELGVDLPEFDFNVPGVTSMSVDLHKYGFTPKGLSVLLQRRSELRDSQYYSCARWSGYSIVNPTMLGSKSLAPLGAAWAVLRKVGRAGYRELVGKMWSATEKLVAGIKGIDGLRVIGNPRMGLVALATDRDVFELADRLTGKGWHVQPTYAYGASPAHIHFTIDPGNAGQVDALVADLAEVSADLPAPIEPPKPVLQLLEAIAGSGGGGGGVNVKAMMGELGVTDGKLPDQQAMIHRLLNGVSPDAREALLVLFLGEIFS